jgi:hypothetical protein
MSMATSNLDRVTACTKCAFVHGETRTHASAFAHDASRLDMHTHAHSGCYQVAPARRRPQPARLIIATHPTYLALRNVTSTAYSGCSFP